MTSAVEFLLVLAGAMVAAVVVGGFVVYQYRKRAHSRRLKRHFNAKKNTESTGQL